MPQRIKALFALIAAVALSLCGCGNFGETPKQFEYYTYGEKAVFGDITFSAAVRGGNEQKAIHEMEELLAEIDKELSLTRSDSALSRFNGAGAYERVEISRTAYEIMEISERIYEETDGLFNIAVRPLTELWGVSSSSEPNMPLPDYESVYETAKYCNPEYLETERTETGYFIYKTHPKLKIDLGAVAKGYAADRCVEIAERNGAESALINISGNICVLGEWYRPDTKAYDRWALGVTAPRPRGGKSGDMCALSVPANKTAVTSGDYSRYREAEQEGSALYVPHIISGVSGLPLGVERDGSGGYTNLQDCIISATVIGDNSAEADAYATALCLMGRERATEFLKSKKLLGILVSADNVMTLAGITESDESGEVYFIYKDETDGYGAYKRYKIEEHSFERR